MKTLILLFTLLVSGIATVGAQVVGEQSLGVRFGMGGAPIGLSYMRVLTHHSAIEIHAGYNPREGRALVGADGQKVLTGMKKGNTFIGIAFQPYLIAGDRDVSTAFYGNLGVRARFHNYFSSEAIPKQVMPKSPVTIDAFGGLGFTFEVHEAFEVFAELDYSIWRGMSEFRKGIQATVGARIRMN